MGKSTKQDETEETEETEKDFGVLGNIANAFLGIGDALLGYDGPPDRDRSNGKNGLDKKSQSGEGKGKKGSSGNGGNVTVNFSLGDAIDRLVSGRGGSGDEGDDGDDSSATKKGKASGKQKQEEGD